MNIPLVGFKADRQQIEILSLAKFYQQSRHYTPKPEALHRVEFHCLFRSHSSGIHHIDFESFAYQAGDIVYIAPGQVHAYDFSHPLSGELIIFTQPIYHTIRTLLPDDSLKLLHSPILRPLAGSELALNACIDQLKQQQLAQLSQICQQLMLANLLLIATQEKRSLNATPKLQHQHQQLLTLIQSNMASSRHGIDYCQSMAMSYTKLNSICVKVSGYTLKRTIDNQVILEAKRLLVTEQLNINQISDRLGFDETTNFSKFFKKYTRVTPKQFRHS
ncbi:helix-turn-helix domain-containing protein [Shewanella sp. 0m-11]